MEPINNSSLKYYVKEDLDTLIGKKLYFNVNELKAFGKLSDEGFILIKDSEVSLKTTQSIPGKIKELRKKYIDDSLLVEMKDKLILTKDIVLSSPSYAAALVAGTSRSGPQSWKDIKGRSLKSLEESLIR